MGFFSRGDASSQSDQDVFGDESFSCSRHSMAWAEHICGECGYQFCGECVVFPFGATKPPLCVACALERGGVRRQQRQKLSKKETKRRLELLHTRRATAEANQQQQPDPFPDTSFEPTLLDSDDPEGFPGAWTQTYS